MVDLVSKLVVWPFIGTNSARKFYRNKTKQNLESVCTGKQLYELVSVHGDTMSVRTYLMEDGALFDEIQITRRP